MCYDSDVSIMNGGLINKKEKNSCKSNKQPLLDSHIKIMIKMVTQKL